MSRIRLTGVAFVVALVAAASIASQSDRAAVRIPPAGDSSECRRPQPPQRRKTRSERYYLAAAESWRVHDQAPAVLNALRVRLESGDPPPRDGTGRDSGGRPD